MPEPVTTRGFKEVDRALATFPARTATALQGLLVIQFIDAKKEIARSSTMSRQAKNALRAKDGVLRILPDRIMRPRRLKDVHAELFSNWRGGRERRTPKEAAASSIEKEIGTDKYRPVRKQGLLIPAGVMLTPTGRPRRKAKKKIDIAAIKDAHFIRRKGGGPPLLVRDLPKQKRGKKGARSEILAVLAKGARRTAKLDFFGGFTRLKGKRSSQYGKMLEKLIRKF